MIRERDGNLELGPLRWPPRVATSIQYGLAGVYLVLTGVRGLEPNAAAELMVYGWLDFWGPAAGSALVMVGMAWIAVDNFRRGLKPR